MAFRTCGQEKEEILAKIADRDAEISWKKYAAACPNSLARDFCQTLVSLYRLHTPLVEFGDRDPGI